MDAVLLSFPVCQLCLRTMSLVDHGRSEGVNGCVLSVRQQTLKAHTFVMLAVKESFNEQEDRRATRVQAQDHSEEGEAMNEDKIINVQAFKAGDYIVVTYDGHNPREIQAPGFKEAGLLGGLIIRSDTKFEALSDEDLKAVGLMRIKDE